MRRLVPAHDDLYFAPPSVFHYTDARGLLGILRCKKLWATDRRFLNDVEEATFARKDFSRRLRRLTNPAHDSAHPLHCNSRFEKAFEDYRRLIVDALSGSRFPAYVTCFSESGDLLSQWRAYGADHGYSIEIETSATTWATSGNEPTDPALRPAHYGLDAVTDDLIAYALNEIALDNNLGHVGTHAHVMTLRIEAMLASLKHPGFEEEREWRFISVYANFPGEDVKFRVSRLAIAPYIEIELPPEAILSVRVGPGAHSDLRREGVCRLVEALGIAADVSVSQIPLRP